MRYKTSIEVLKENMVAISIASNKLHTVDMTHAEKRGIAKFIEVLANECVMKMRDIKEDCIEEIAHIDEIAF